MFAFSRASIMWRNVVGEATPPQSGLLPLVFDLLVPPRARMLPSSLRATGRDTACMFHCFVVHVSAPSSCSLRSLSLLGQCLNVRHRYASSLFVRAMPRQSRPRGRRRQRKDMHRGTPDDKADEGQLISFVMDGDSIQRCRERWSKKGSQSGPCFTSSLPPPDNGPCFSSLTLYSSPTRLCLCLVRLIPPIKELKGILTCW